MICTNVKFLMFEVKMTGTVMQPELLEFSVKFAFNYFGFPRAVVITP
jgi:hypothetical protein